MSKLIITFNKLGNSSFTDDKNYEIARILKNLAEKIEEGYYPSKLMDINGNKVGSVEEVE
jgi:hypothetical protein